jgi:hypothetical protein
MIVKRLVLLSIIRVTEPTHTMSFFFFFFRMFNHFHIWSEEVVDHSLNELR